MDIDDDIRDMVNNIVLNPDDDPEIKLFKSFIKVFHYVIHWHWNGLKYHAHVQTLYNHGERNIKLCQEYIKIA